MLEYYLNKEPFTEGTYGREQRSSFVAEYPYQFKEIHKEPVFVSMEEIIKTIKKK